MNPRNPIARAYHRETLLIHSAHSGLGPSATALAHARLGVYKALADRHDLRLVLRHVEQIKHALDALLADAAANAIRTRCAVCKRHLRGPYEAPPERTSDSICPSCERKLELDAAVATCRQVAERTFGE